MTMDTAENPRPDDPVTSASMDAVVGEQETPPNNDAGQQLAQDRMDEFADRGVVGDKVDPLPDAVYTVPGRLAEGQGARPNPNLPPAPGPSPAQRA